MTSDVGGDQGQDDDETDRTGSAPATTANQQLCQISHLPDDDVMGTGSQVVSDQTSNLVAPLQAPDEQNAEDADDHCQYCEEDSLLVPVTQIQAFNDKDDSDGSAGCRVEERFGGWIAKRLMRMKKKLAEGLQSGVSKCRYPHLRALGESTLKVCKHSQASTKGIKSRDSRPTVLTLNQDADSLRSGYGRRPGTSPGSGDTRLTVWSVLGTTWTQPAGVGGSWHTKQEQRRSLRVRGKSIFEWKTTKKAMPDQHTIDHMEDHVVFGTAVFTYLKLRGPLPSSAPYGDAPSVLLDVAAESRELWQKMTMATNMPTMHVLPADRQL